MSGTSRTMLFWAAILLIGAIVLTVIFRGWWLEDVLHFWDGTATAVVAIALLLMVQRRRRHESTGRRPVDWDDDPIRPVTDFSVASTLFALSLALIALGLPFGVWLVEVGCGMLVVSIAGLIRELRAEAAARRHFRQGRPG